MSGVKNLFHDDFEDFLIFWNNEVEKKLFRHSKECGVFNKIKKALNPLNKPNWDDNLRKYYNQINDELLLNNDCVIDLSVGRKYCVKTASNSRRHFSQIMVFFVLQHSEISEDKKREVFIEMDKELFKKSKIRNFFLEKWYYIKLFFS